MNYMGNNPADAAPVSVWGIANPHLVDMFNPNFDIEGGNPFMKGGSSGGFRMSMMPQGNNRSAYEAAMADTYANVRVGTDANGNAIYGYTGQDERPTGGVNMSRAGTLADKVNPYYGTRPNAPLGDPSNPRKNYGVSGIYQNVGGPAGGYIVKTNNTRVTGGR